jgi:methionyl-tRNA formyltransferase
MAVTLHAIDAELDTGPVYESRPIGKIAGLSLANFRYHTAVLCTDMFMDVIKGIAAGTTQAFPQSGEGRYFGPMPTRLKLRTEKMLQSYCAA